MKRNIDKQISYDSNVAFDGYDAKISEADMGKLWDLLQDPYKNPIGAVVREYVSNSFDSHAEAKFIKEHSIEEIRAEYSIYKEYDDAHIEELKAFLEVFDNDAVKVSIGKDDTGHFWATEDFGVGLSPERMRDVFCSYLKSTKEDTNELIGAFGIGSKSGLSYTDVVYIRTRYNGYEYFYLLRKGERAPRLDVVFKNPTTERNGTEIKIYIKNFKKYSFSTSEPEIYRFQEECIKQLAYFDNVYFSGLSIDNEYNVFEGDHWKYTTNKAPFSGLHLCLGKVAYPIDWDSLGVSPINFSVALKFEIGELDVIQTREDVKYTPRTKQAILDKIVLLKEEMLMRWKSQNEYHTDDLFKYIINRDTFYTLQLESLELILDNLFTEEELPKWEFNPFKNIGYDSGLIEKEAFFIDYYIPSYVNSSGLKHNRQSVFDALKRKKPLYRIEGNHDAKKSKYIFSEVEKNVFYFLRKDKPNLKRYKTILKLSQYPKSEWRIIITIFQKEVKKVLIAHSKSYANTVISPDWLKSIRKQVTAREKGIFTAYKLDPTSYNNVFRPINLQKEKMTKAIKTLNIVGLKEDREWLIDMYDYLRHTHISSRYIQVYYVAVSNAKYFSSLSNLLNPVNYMNNPLFAKSCTAARIRHSPEFRNLRKVYSYLEYYSKALENVNKQISESIKDLRRFQSKYLSTFSRIDPFSSQKQDEFLISIYRHVEKNSLWEETILNKAKAIEEYLSHIPLITCLNKEEITQENLVMAIYRFNKSAPKKYWKKINPMWYVNLNEQEIKWLSEVDRDYYHTLKLL